MVKQFPAIISRNNNHIRKNLFSICLSALLYISCAQVFAATVCPTIQVCFTPGENCTAKIVDAIDHAENSLYIQAYSFTSTPIAKAVVNAKERGVEVKVILDKSQKNQRYSSSKYLVNQGVPTWIDYKPAIAHNKVMIIDQRKVITGSFNFTSAAQNKNAENLLIINDSILAKAYYENWEKRVAVSLKLES